MSAMEISSHLEFAATPADVYAMMTDQKYLDEVCVASGSFSYHVAERLDHQDVTDLAGAGVGGKVHRADGHCQRGSRLG